MSFLDKLGKGNHEDDENQQVVSKDNKELQNHKLYVYNIEEVRIDTIDSDTSITIVEDQSENSISLGVCHPGDKEPQKLLTCKCSSKSEKAELKKMIEILISDITKAFRNGVEVFVMPETDFDLYAYIKNRPSIDIDLEQLEQELNNSKSSDIKNQFTKNVQKGKRLDVFVAKIDLYNVEAGKMIADAYQKYPSVHIHEIESSGNDEITWLHNGIENVIRANPSATNIGIGVTGIKPLNGIAILQDDKHSVITKTASLIGKQMNAREILLDAQATKHAAGMIKVGQKRSMTKEVVVKAIHNMAREAALYKVHEFKYNEFEKAAESASVIENGLYCARLPFNDTVLVKNYFPESLTGLLVIIKDEELYYYGKRETMMLLTEQYGWKNYEEGVVNRKFDNRDAIYELSEMTSKLKYIDHINEILNKRDNIKLSYNEISAAAKKYDSDMGMDKDYQISLLKYVNALQNDEQRLNSIKRIITEALTQESPFQPFGGLFRSGGLFRK